MTEVRPVPQPDLIASGPAGTRGHDAPAGRPRRHPLVGMSLRVRLVAGLLVLAAIGLTVSGAAAVVALRGYLDDRVDSQLTLTAQQIQNRLERQLSSPDELGYGGGPVYVPSAYFVQIGDAQGKALIPPSRYTLRSGEKPPKLPTWTPAQAKSHGSSPFFVAATSGSGRWRTVAVPLSTGQYTLFVAVDTEDTDGTVHRLVGIVVLVSLGVLLLLGLLAFWLVQSSLRPLREVQTTAGAIATGDLTRRVSTADERTEVGRLGSAFNAMVARIEQAFGAQAASEAQALASAEQAQRSEEQARTSEERMWQFVADASHELRTPLTSIRGFAELYRQGAVRDPADVARAMNRIEDEGTRMSGLVEDLLLLARLDQQRPLERAPLDLRHLVDDAAEDTAALAPERTVTHEVPAEPVVVLGDDGRLRQVLGNLVGNALRYTPASASIALRLRTEHGAAVLEVADDGPGMSAADAAKVFERFYRADTARSRAQGGSGLGLSIVASLTAAHDGTYGLTTAPGEGATFTIRLPLATP